MSCCPPPPPALRLRSAAARTARISISGVRGALGSLRGMPPHWLGLGLGMPFHWVFQPSRGATGVGTLRGATDFPVLGLACLEVSRLLREESWLVEDEEPLWLVEEEEPPKGICRPMRLQPAGSVAPQAAGICRPTARAAALSSTSAGGCGGGCGDSSPCSCFTCFTLGCGSGCGCGRCGCGRCKSRSGGCCCIKGDGAAGGESSLDDRSSPASGGESSPEPPATVPPAAAARPGCGLLA